MFPRHFTHHLSKICKSIRGMRGEGTTGCSHLGFKEWQGPSFYKSCKVRFPVIVTNILQKLQKSVDPVAIFFRHHKVKIVQLYKYLDFVKKGKLQSFVLVNWGSKVLAIITTFNFLQLTNTTNVRQSRLNIGQVRNLDRRSEWIPFFIQKPKSRE